MLKRKLLGSLAFRVLFSSFIFVAFPLTFYAIYSYNRDYDQKLNDIFNEMHLFQKDQLNFMKELEESNLNFLKALHQMILLVTEQSGKTSLDKVDKILNNYS